LTEIANEGASKGLIEGLAVEIVTVPDVPCEEDDPMQEATSATRQAQP
jgi:hypothetical protein